MGPKTITFLRHADNVWDPESKDLWQAESPLSRAGATQCRAIKGRYLHRKPFRYVYYSCMRRSRQTAHLLEQNPSHQEEISCLAPLLSVRKKWNEYCAPFTHDQGPEALLNIWNNHRTFLKEQTTEILCFLFNLRRTMISGECALVIGHRPFISLVLHELDEQYGPIDAYPHTAEGYHLRFSSTTGEFIEAIKLELPEEYKQPCVLH